MIFCPQNIDYLMNIKKMLITFHMASGLQVNFQKSSFLGVNVDPLWLRFAAHSLQCKIDALPFTYLGLLNGGITSRLKTWDPVLHRMYTKLASWKGKLLYIGGRITLIKACLSNLPLYYLSLFPIPKGIIEEICKIRRKFLWSGDYEKKAFPLVSQSLLELHKKLGGLDISNLLHHNISLLFKWWWHFITEPNALWRKVVHDKYGYGAPFSLTDIVVPSNGGPWKHICSSILHAHNVKPLVATCVGKRVGNGSSTLFWHDLWVENSPLKITFPRLFLLSTIPNSLIISMGFWNGPQWALSFEWKHNLRPRDNLELAQLLASSP